jgi:hypothetical protein
MFIIDDADAILKLRHVKACAFLIVSQERNEWFFFEILSDRIDILLKNDGRTFHSKVRKTKKRLKMKTKTTKINK